VAQPATPHQARLAGFPFGERKGGESLGETKPQAGLFPFANGGPAFIRRRKLLLNVHWNHYPEHEKVIMSLPVAALIGQAHLLAMALEGETVVELAIDEEAAEKVMRYRNSVASNESANIEKDMTTIREVVAKRQREVREVIEKAKERTRDEGRGVGGLY
jgi:hypothetical protein